MDDVSLTRRRVAQAGATAGLGLLARGLGAEPIERVVERGRIRQSVCKWCYPRLSVEELCAAAAGLGLHSVELLGPESYEVVRRHGLVCAVTNTHSIPKGLNRPEHHEACLGAIRTAIEAAARAGFPNVITFSGNREGMPDDVGLEHCVTALEQVAAEAERKGVTILLELLNSKVDHPDYMGDRVEWGVELMRRVGSERCKLLFDIYHVQIMEGDIIRTLQTHHELIGHYHTAGVPGRHELDDTQELQYAAIMRAIADTGFQGFVGQEFIPAREPLRSLAEAVRLCDV
ncbi:MAG TPA: TIM barrel protein [Thermoanaerobaculia bacterium]|nr:TIM barrel protein [Thermoanaerobaculia bacterium]